MMLARFVKFFLILFLIIGWIFSGWPQIWQNPPIPPEVQETKAAAIAQNIIVAWPYASSTIPGGWYRSTALDGYFLIGTSSNPGLTGGALTHTHTAASHTHTQTNTHTHVGNPSTGAVVESSYLGTLGGTNGNATNHTHTIPDLAAGTDTITATTTNIAAASNLPPYREVLWIYNADGSTEIPTGAIAFFAAAGDVPATGWTTATSTGLFYRGAAVSTDPNAATQGSDSHTHTSSHTHNATKGAHASVNTAQAVASTAASGAGTNIGRSTHVHAVTSDTGTYITGAADGNITSLTTLPPFIGLVAAQVTGAANTPTNVIAIWGGAIGFIPANWNLCQSGGAVCNVDVVNRFVMATTTANLLKTGGVTNHTHSAGTHVHTTSHTHTLAIGAASLNRSNTASTNAIPPANHTHQSVTSAASSAADTDPATLTVNTSTAETRPPFYGVAFIQYQQPTSLTFTVSTDVFGSIVPGGSAKFATSTLNVNTNNSLGWYVTLYGNNQGSGAASTTMYLTGPVYTTQITDQAEWIPGSATTTAGNAVRINSLDNTQNVLAFRVMTASSTNSAAFWSTTWWGTTDSYVDNAATLWSGIASSTVQRQIGNAGSGSYSASNHLNTVLYYLKTVSTQQAGAYTGDLTYTGTTNP